VARRATEFITDDARATEFFLRLKTTLDYFALLAVMEGLEPPCCTLALEILDDIEAAGR
jgi:hypothetical protein